VRLDLAHERVAVGVGLDLDLEQQAVVLDPLEQGAADVAEDDQRDQDDGGPGQREGVEADGDGHADGGGDPHRGGRREAAHRHAVVDDRAGAEEADARDDLGGDARRVDRGGAPQVAEAVGGDQGEDGGAHAHEHVRAHAGRLVAGLSLQSHEPAQQDDERQSKREIEVGEAHGAQDGTRGAKASCRSAGAAFRFREDERARGSSRARPARRS
jgi:hypothetical protein